MALKGSKTEENLKAAFAGESQANRRYLYFASKADVEGYNDVSAVFRSTAEGETGHAHGHLEYLEVVGDPATGLPIGDTAKNLKAAIPSQSAIGAAMSDDMREAQREGSLEAPTRHPLDWQAPEFYSEPALIRELERVFDICHGCRRCFSLCNAFPTLFDAIDASETMELDGVDKKDFWKVVDHCYLCDMCYMTKCPYVPPHPWNVDFPHLMLRAKAVKFRNGDYRFRNKLLSSTDLVGRIAGIPVIAQAVNAANRNRGARKLLDMTLGVHPDAHLPEYHSDTLRKRAKRRESSLTEAVARDETHGRVALFTTCYGNRNEPGLGEDLIRILEYNEVPITLLDDERCCGMPKLEIGDLDAVRRARLQYSAPFAHGRRRPGYHRTGAVMCADAEAGIPAAVSR